MVVDGEGARRPREHLADLKHEACLVACDKPSAATVRSVDVDASNNGLAPTSPVGSVAEVLPANVFEHPQVDTRDVVDLAIRDERPVLEEQAATAQCSNERHGVADEKHGPAFRSHVSHLPEALLLECNVADGQHLVDNQDLGLEVRGDREAEADFHPARVALHRRVEEAFDVGEGDDLVEAAVDLVLSHAEDRAGQEDVLAPRQLGMEPGAYVEERTDASGYLRPALRRFRDPRQDLEDRRLTRTVDADHADRLALSDLERDILQGPEPPPLSLSCTCSGPPHRGRRRVRNALPDRAVAVIAAEAITLRDSLGLDDRRRHFAQMTSAKRSSLRRKK